jgi:hypothetical protein
MLLWLLGLLGLLDLLDLLGLFCLLVPMRSVGTSWNVSTLSLLYGLFQEEMPTRFGRHPRK